MKLSSRRTPDPYRVISRKGSVAETVRKTSPCGYGSRIALRLSGTTWIGLAFSRRIAPEVCWNFYALFQFRGRRECRMRAAPAVSCAVCTESARMSIQGSGEHPTFLRNGFTAYNVL